MERTLSPGSSRESSAPGRLSYVRHPISLPAHGRSLFWEGILGDAEMERSITAFDLKTIFVRWSLWWRNPRIGQTSLTKRETRGVSPPLHVDSFDAARSPNIRSKHPSVRRRGPNLFTWCSTIKRHPLVSWPWTRRSSARERERRARRWWRWRRGDGGRNFISARINFNDAEDATAIRRGLKLRILWLQPVLRILCFSFFNLGPLVFHTISYEHTRPLSNPFSLYFLSRLLSPGAR